MVLAREEDHGIDALKRLQILARTRAVEGTGAKVIHP